MPRLCFVIMPFSSTDSCTEEEWTQLYEEVFKPAVETADLDYECRRSSPDRGNLLRGIMEDLYTSYVVLADLTDRNPNVFYELGVRHTLTNRTILVAQSQEFIPFDLQQYAYHLYDWQTEEGRKEFAARIRSLLEEVDDSPDRPDNPVSDFLDDRPVESELHSAQGAALPFRGGAEARLEAVEDELADLRAVVEEAGLSRAGGSGRRARPRTLGMLSKTPMITESPAPVAWAKAAREVAQSQQTKALRRLVKRVQREIGTAVPQRIRELNEGAGGRIAKKDIGPRAVELEQGFSALTVHLEQFCLELGDHDWRPGARATLDFAGALISAGESQTGGLRFALGLPSFFAWRVLLFAGAKAIEAGSFDFINDLISEPIEMREAGGRYSHRPLYRHRDLFYPEAQLGYADLAVQQVAGSWERTSALHPFFDDAEDFQRNLATFLMLVALRDADAESERRLYPGYRLIAEATSARDQLVARLTGRSGYLKDIARSFGETAKEFTESWPARAKAANDAELGTEYFPRSPFDEWFPPTLQKVAQNAE